MCVGALIAASSGVVIKSRKLRRAVREAVVEVREPADAVVRLAALSDADDAVIELGIQRGATEVVIDLTGDDVALGTSDAPGLVPWVHTCCQWPLRPRQLDIPMGLFRTPARFISTPSTNP